MDPEIQQQLAEQLRELAELLSQQNGLMRQNINAATAATNASKQETAAKTNATTVTTRYQQAQQQAATSTVQSSERFAKGVEIASNIIGAAAQGVSRTLMAFGYAAASGKEGLAKYGEAIDSAANMVSQVTAKMGLLGVAIDIVVANYTKQAKDALELNDKMTSLQRELVKTSGALPVTRTELTRLANSAGFAMANMEKFQKAMQTAGSGLVGLGQNAGQGAVKFAEVAKVGEETRQRFDRLGVSFDQLAEYQARYIKQQTISGNAMALQAKSATQIRQESILYAENLVKLTGLTGKQADQLQAEADKVRLAANEQLAVLAENAQIARLRKEGKDEEANRLEAERNKRQEVTGKIGQFLSPELAIKVGQVARSGSTAAAPELAQLGFSAEEIKSITSDKENGAARFFDLYKQRAGGMSERLGTAREFLTPEQKSMLGVGDEAAIQQLNVLNSANTMQERQKIIDKQLAEAGKSGKDKIADENAQIASDERKKAAEYSERLIGLLNEGLPKLKEGIQNFENIAKMAAITLGILAAAATAASLALSASAAMNARRAAGAAGAAGAARGAGAAGAAGAAGIGSKLARGAKGLLGKVALPVAIGMGLYDSFQGYNADPTASFGDKLKNAGSSALSGLTFGLLGSSPEEIAARKAAGVSGTAGAASGLPSDYEDLERLQSAAKDKIRADQQAASLTEESAESAKTTFGSLNRTLEVTNKSLNLFKDLLNLLNQVLSPSAAASGQAPTTLGGMTGASPSDSSSSAFSPGGMPSTTSGGISNMPGTPGAASIGNMPGVPGGSSIGMLGDQSYGPNGGMSGMPSQFDGNLGKILATIRQVETGNKYDTPGPRGMAGTASGAYAFIDSSWRALTRKYGVGTEYPRAFMAPPGIQDQVAARYAQEILEKAGGDVSKIPIAWYTGNIHGKISAAAIALNKGNTPQMYQEKWMRVYNGQGGEPMMAGGMPMMGGMPQFGGGGMMGIMNDGGLIGNMAMRNMMGGMGMSPYGGMMGGMGMMPFGGMMGGMGMNNPYSGLSMGMGAHPNIVQLGRMLQSQGLRVSENPAFGGVAPVHKGRGHYEGRAIDVNVGVGNKEAYDPVHGSRFDQLAAQLRQAGYSVVWRAPGHYDHMHVEVPGLKKAAKGGIFSGPKTGYPVELHGTEMITPLTPNSLLMDLAKMPANHLLDKDMSGVKGSPMNSVRDLQKTVSSIVSNETNKALDSINQMNQPMQTMTTEISNSMRQVMEAHNKTMYDLTYRMSEMIDALNVSNDVTKKILKKASA